MQKAHVGTQCETESLLLQAVEFVCRPFRDALQNPSPTLYGILQIDAGENSGDPVRFRQITKWATNRQQGESGKCRAMMKF